MIRGLAGRAIKALFHRRSPRRLPPGIRQRARNKPVMLNSARRLDDPAILPGKRLEALKGDDRAGQYSIRINDRRRVCFVWRDGDAYGVEIVDDHRG